MQSLAFSSGTGYLLFWKSRELLPVSVTNTRVYGPVKLSYIVSKGIGPLQSDNPFHTEDKCNLSPVQFPDFAGFGTASTGRCIK